MSCELEATGTSGRASVAGEAGSVRTSVVQRNATRQAVENRIIATRQRTWERRESIRRRRYQVCEPNRYKG